MELYEAFKELNKISLREDKLMPGNKIKQLFSTWMNEIISIDSSLIPDNSLVFDHDGFNSGTTYGKCKIGNREPFKLFQVISLNKYICTDATIDIMKNNFVHELCHYYANKDAFKMGYYYFDDSGELQRDVNHPRKQDFIANDCHGSMWQKYADFLTKALNLKYPVVAHIEPRVFFELNNKSAEHATIQITCSENCSKNPICFFERSLDDFKREQNGLNNVIAIFALEVQPQLCGRCQHETKVNFIDKKLKDELTNYVAEQIQIRKKMRGIN